MKIPAELRHWSEERRDFRVNFFFPLLCFPSSFSTLGPSSFFFCWNEQEAMKNLNYWFVGWKKHQNCRMNRTHCVGASKWSESSRDPEISRKSHLSNWTTVGSAGCDRWLSRTVSSRINDEFTEDRRNSSVRWDERLQLCFVVLSRSSSISHSRSKTNLAQLDASTKCSTFRSILTLRWATRATSVRSTHLTDLRLTILKGRREKIHIITRKLFIVFFLENNSTLRDDDDVKIAIVIFSTQKRRVAECAELFFVMILSWRF